MWGIYKKKDKIIAIGDLHGDYLQLLSILKHAKLIEHKENRQCINISDCNIKNWKWIGGNTYLIQMGDIFDSGGRSNRISFTDNELGILNFLVNLKELAKKDNGNVLVIFGNHEFMNFEKDWRYAQSLKLCNENKCNDREEYFKFGGIIAKLFKKIKTRGIIKIGSNIFVHGGVKYELAKKYSIRTMNELLDKYLFDNLDSIEKNKFNKIYGKQGLIWFREYVQNENLCNMLEKSLNKLNADRMIVGHTIQPDGISTKCKKYTKKLYAIDVGLSRAFGSTLKCQYLTITNDNNIKINECNVFKQCN